MSTTFKPRFFKIKKYIFLFCIFISVGLLIFLLIAIFVGNGNQYLDHVKGLRDKFNPGDHNLTVMFKFIILTIYNQLFCF